MNRAGLLGAALVVLSGAGAAHGQAQVEAPDTSAVDPVDPRAARTPFGLGEHLVYRVKVGIFGVGYGHMTLDSQVDTVRGHRTYRATMGIEGRLTFASVDDEYQSWFDTRSLQTWRYIRDVHQINYKSLRHFEMYPERRRWERADNDEFGTLGSSLPLDDVSFIYFIRTLPLEVGKTYTLNRYFKDDGNPVVIRVVRRDQREVGAGTFNTIVVEPIIKTDGLFGEGGEAELHFTDDERRLLVYLKSDIPNFPGSLTLHLENIQEGLPLHPANRDRARARHAETAITTGQRR
ncbi:MAG: DUF3108 domain-containing protein [Longimicrobiales bacterium]